MTTKFLVFLFIGLLAASRHSRVLQPKRVDVMLFGQAAVGKTSISERITTGNFNEGTTATIGADHSIVKSKGSDDSIKEFVLWDTAGQERFAQMSGLYYRRAHIAVVVYSKSFIAATESVKRLHDENQKSPAIILVGSKADQDEGLHIGLPLTELASAFCQQNDLPHLLVSSKENTNIEILLRWISSEIVNIEAAEMIELQNKASVDGSRFQLDMDEDYMKRGSDRHVVLDDSCC